MTDEAPVLIAGGGLVGLSAAAFLARQGVRSLTIERLDASSPLPRAAFFHMRTLEIEFGHGFGGFHGLDLSARLLGSRGSLVAIRW